MSYRRISGIINPICAAASAAFPHRPSAVSSKRAYSYFHFIPFNVEPPQVTSSTSDGDIAMMIVNGDSGFQEMSPNAELSNEVPFDDSPPPVAASSTNYQQSQDDTHHHHNHCHHHHHHSEKNHSYENGTVGDSPAQDGTTVPPATDCDVDDAASDVSDISCASCISDMSGQDWKPISGPIAWIHQQMCSGTNPHDILQELIPDASIPSHLDNLTLWRLIVNMLSEPPRRKKLPQYNTINDVVDLIKRSNRIVVLTGAGVRIGFNLVLI